MKYTCLAAIAFAIIAGLSINYMSKGLVNPDAIGKLAVTTLGGAVLCFLAPFWVAYRGKLPLPVVSIIAFAVVIVGFHIMAKACLQAGTYASSIIDQFYMLMFSIPGLIVLAKQSEAQSTKNPQLRQLDNGNGGSEEQGS